MLDKMNLVMQKEASYFANYGKWIGGEKGSGNSMPIFRRSFSIDKKIAQAMVLITGVGHYELLLNGKKVNDYVLTPAWTNYEKSVCYQQIDITDQIQSGDNCFGVYLGNGMYHVEGIRYAKFKDSFGEIGFIMRACILYIDGSTDIICSDTSWVTRPGPITFSCVYGGEDYNAKIDCEDWFRPDTQLTKHWKSAHEIVPPKGRLVPEINPPLKVMEIIKAKYICAYSEGKFLYDTEKNISGWTRITLKGKSGYRLKVTPYEMRDKDGELSQQFTGSPHYYQYICKGKDIEVWEPRFTYYGFRYIKIECFDEDGRPAKEGILINSVEGCMIYPDIELAGEFTCSDPMINNIHEIILQAILCNMKTVFTDCPHREKLGWLEQLHLNGPSIMYNYQVHTLYRKIMEDMEQAQQDNGLIPDIAPEYINFDTENIHTGFRDSPEWGSAGIIVPWYLYIVYKDVEVLEKYFLMMERYLSYLTSKSEYHILHHGLGDWCDFGINPPYVQNTIIPITATAIYYYDIQIMEKICELLSKNEQRDYYQDLGNKVKKAFNREFYDSQGYRYGTGSQTANAMALFLDLVNDKDEDKVIHSLVNDIILRDYHTTGGDVGHPFILRALDKFHQAKIVGEMLKKTDAPSYGYQILHGATTLCEEWNGNDPKNPSSSQNHFMLGSIEEWFYSGLAGLKTVHQDCGDEIIIAPSFIDHVDWVKAWHLYPAGKVSVEWRKEDQKISVQILMPAGVNGKFIFGMRTETLLAGTNYFIINRINKSVSRI